MKKTIQFICKNLIFRILALIACIVNVNVSFAQCSTGSGPSYSNTCSHDYITSITASGTGVTSTINVSSGSCGGTYYDYYTTQGVTVTPGATVNMAIARSSSSYTGYLSVYVDWSNSGTYTAADLAGTLYTWNATSYTYSFTVPTTGVVSGTNLHMRMMLSESSSGAPCTATYGETCDFYINVNCTTPVISVLPASGSMCSGGGGVSLTASGAGTGGSYTWSPSSGLSATTGAAVTAEPTATGLTIYTVTGTTGIGCSSTATASVTVNPSPGAITGASALCAGSSATLSDPTASGTWSSSNTNAATIDPSGDVYSIAAGTTIISYTLGSGCAATASVSVTALPPAITGNTNVCMGQITTLSDAVTGGAWTSGNPAIATVMPSGGVVSGVAAGSAPVTYTLGTCTSSTTVTVNSLPAAITGVTTICAGLTSALSDATASGTWTSGSIGVATIGATGIVTGVTSGTSVITYTAPIGCTATTNVTVNAMPAAITGAASVCAGATASLSDATTGGTWSSGNIVIATVSGTGVVSGVSGGITDISYTLGSCSASATLTVVSIPAITGPAGLCSGATISLTDAVAGGVWSSDNISVATVSGGGVVSGIATGTTDISYTSGGCSNDISITVSTLTPVIGNGNVCVGLTTALSDATPGGVWSSSGTNVATVTTTGVVTGVVSGGTTISYTIGFCNATLPLSVGNAISGISTPPAVCEAMATTLNDPTPGGVWTSANTAIATIISNTGLVSGVAPGTDIISYTVSSCTVTDTITVNVTNAGTITGMDTVCAGIANAVTFTDAVPGGVWSISNTSHATVVSGTGVVTGVLYGIDTLKYTVTNSCGTFKAKLVIHILPASQCPAGISPVAGGQITELKVFPNPNGGAFTMNLFSDNNVEVHVLITNIVGEKVREFITTTNKATDIQLDPAAGIYLLSASTTDGKYVAKIVVY